MLRLNAMKENIKAHFINVRTVKKVIRERIKKKMAKKREEKCFLSKGNNPGC